MSGKIEAGAVGSGDSLISLPGPAEEVATVKGLLRNGEAVRAAVAGDSVELGVSGVEEASFAVTGSVLCHPDAPVRCHNIAAVWVAFSPSGLHSSQDSSDIVVGRGPGGDG